MAILRLLLQSLKHVLLPLRIRFGLRHRRAPFIVEVGANDGKTGDPLYRLIKNDRRCRALLIEPLPHLFERLEKSYTGVSQSILANVAISSTPGTQTIWYIDPAARNAMPTLPTYFEQLASFDKQRVAGALGTEGISFLRERTVETLPLDQLLARYHLSAVDLLLVDTEGHDFEVLKTFPFDRILPALVCFEHSHLSETDRADAVGFMKRHRYSVERWGKDHVCAYQA